MKEDRTNEYRKSKIKTQAQMCVNPCQIVIFNPCKLILIQKQDKEE